MQPIGKIVSSHGVKGDIILEHYFQDRFDYSNWDALMIELLPNSRIPFFIEKIKPQNDTTLLVKLEEIQSPEDAKEIIQKSVFLSPNVPQIEQIAQIPLDNYIGYQLFNQDNEIGIIDNILNPTTNPLFILYENQENELLVPANSELILEVQHETKRIIMQLPEGLL